MDDAVVAGVKAAYEKAPESWSGGPAKVYRALAEALVALAPADLHGRLVLDLGTGTGVAADALVAAGAHPVGVDLALAMLRHDRARRPPGVVGDARALPFAAAAFDGVVAAFSVNHVPEPRLALAEAARVTRPAGFVLASSFSARREHPARAAVEDVLVRFGFHRPAWFAAFKERMEPAVGGAGPLAATARAAGLVDVDVLEVDVDTAVRDPASIAEWRLGMAQYVDFLSGLDPSTRADLEAAARQAVAPHTSPDVPVLFLTARVPWARHRR